MHVGFANACICNVMSDLKPVALKITIVIATC